ncbi:MAG: 2,3-bisphosphoglycerate-independent phosphoglycerate mutase [Acidobacteria bacterium]|nr:2,3-bisphosphoglycerate-independent phosphoglycerate mutase [Acidobacteriota bacterium]
MKTRDSRSGPETPSRTIRVVDSAGGHHPFLRGMVTHDLVQRGFSFDDAYAAAHALRDRLVGREEISTAELKDELQQQLEEMFGAEISRRLGKPGVRGKTLEVDYDGQIQPFSRGLLARSLYVAGVDLDRAYRLVGQLQGELVAEGVSRLSNAEVALRVGDLLERQEGGNVASRYRLMRGVRRLPKPVVIYISGATGTGKSTLAVELAPLLRIYRINATDTIRQVMRMVFSSAILPSLHRSSFEVDSLEAASWEDSAEGPSADPRKRIIAAFEDQATRVLVGVRGVVERSVAENTSLIVEGVHLIPPHVPFADLQGSSYQVLLTLSTLDREVHRARFLSRGVAGLRRAERYLGRFEAIRVIQDHLLHRSENHGVPLVDTADGETTLQRSLRLLSSMLEKQVPQLAGPVAEPEPKIPSLLLIIDGMPDRPVRALGGRTPLQAAHTPTLDRLAREGSCGLADPVAPDVVPDTAAGSLALFGQSPVTLQRGPVEALGAGLSMEAGDVALRGNFASLDAAGQVIDRRAGRIREDAEELATALDRMRIRDDEGEVVVRVRSSTEHRLAVVLKGAELASSISGSDPGDGAPPGPPLVPRASDSADPKAERTARILARFEEEARRILREHPVNQRRSRAGEVPANVLLTRGAGQMHRPLPSAQVGLPRRLTCVSGDGTVLGIASWLGAEARSTDAMTANLDTDLRAKFQSALDALRSRDLVVVHVKGADIAAHDLRPDLKAQFLEAVDKELSWFLEKWRSGPLRIAVASDHGTLSESGQHSADPVPVLLWGEGIPADEVQTYDEHAASTGSLQRFPLQLLVRRLVDGGS